MSVALFTQDEQGLEMGRGSKKKKVVGCPHCKSGRVISVNCVGFICKQCNKWISEGDFLPESECESMVNQNIPINKEFTKLKGKKEKGAYDWADKMKKEGKLGTRHHEPGGAKRNW